MTEVYFLHHIDERTVDGHPDDKLIGIYSTPERAREAIRRLRDQPGFKDYPERWKIQERTLDHDNWTEGFVKETHQPIQ